MGYVSADFFHHSVSFFIEAVLRNHDRQRVHVVCYSSVRQEDAKTRMFQSRRALALTVTTQLAQVCKSVTPRLYHV